MRNENSYIKDPGPIVGIPAGCNHRARMLAAIAFGGCTYEEAAEVAIDIGEHFTPERQTEIINFLCDMLTELGLEIGGDEELLNHLNGRRR